jgi:hypothetical protein
VRLLGRDLQRIRRATGGPAAGAIAMQLVAELEATARRERVVPLRLAEAYLGLGDLDGAFRYLDSALAERQPALVWFSLRLPRWEPARRDPRFTELMAKMGLDAEGRPHGGDSASRQ